MRDERKVGNGRPSTFERGRSQTFLLALYQITTTHDITVEIEIK